MAADRGAEIEGTMTRRPRPIGSKIAFGEGFRTPAPREPVVQDGLAGVRKPPKEETAGSMGLCAGAPYGDLKVVDGARASALEREAESRGAREGAEELV
jgi:hypothetical protein